MSAYHAFVLSRKEGVERVYLEHAGETREEAEKKLKRSQRKRIIGYRVARPTSAYRAEAEANDLPFPLPIPNRRRRRR